ncbi:MAG: ribbon-helix-helix domain-containing protein [Methanomassiliicoccales archaeon]|jgi:Arc/MetJ-type ribon-helix-helix transcriptional regulator
MPRKSAIPGKKSASQDDPSTGTTETPGKKDKRIDPAHMAVVKRSSDVAEEPAQRKIDVSEPSPVDEGKVRETQPDSPNKSRIVNLRVPVQIVEDIDYWVSNGRYRSRSEFLLAATRYYLDYIEYRESYNTRTFQRGQMDETPAERIDRLRYLRGAP